MRVLLYVLAIIVPAVVCYLIGSFAILSFDLHKWDDAGRFVAALAWVVLSSVLCASVNDVLED